MKFLIIAIAGILISCASNEREDHGTLTRVGTPIFDTTFVRDTMVRGSRWMIFIDPVKQSPFKVQIADFAFGGEESENEEHFNNAFARLPKGSGVKPPASLLAMDSEWLPVYRYNGEYYLYAPSDWGTHNKLKFTDSCLISWSMEGPQPIRLTALTTEDRGFAWTEISPWQEPSGERFEIIDRERMIALYNDQHYIARKRMHDLYVMVNWSQSKAEELPDLGELSSLDSAKITGR